VEWAYDGTIRAALWIGGGQWAGKTTVSWLLAERFTPVVAQRDRLERDRLVAADAVRRAREHGVRVIEVDGSRDAESVAGEVAEHFRSFLP
jgi:hypothetical protein